MPGQHLWVSGPACPRRGRGERGERRGERGEGRGERGEEGGEGRGGREREKGRYNLCLTSVLLFY